MRSSRLFLIASLAISVAGPLRGEEVVRCSLGTIAVQARQTADISPAACRVEVADMQDVGCCVIRNGTNGWDWSDNDAREQCIRSARAAGISTPDAWYHYPNETCDAVKVRCRGPNPC
jgi:hypothetical protein